MILSVLLGAHAARGRLITPKLSLLRSLSRVNPKGLIQSLPYCLFLLGALFTCHAFSLFGGTPFLERTKVSHCNVAANV